MLAVFQELVAPGVLAVRAPFVYDTSGATLPVRAYYRARSRIPGPVRMWGAGGYATSEVGHRRFGEFADVTADDSWFDEHFAPDEKRVAPTVPARVRTPRDTAGLLAVLTRQHRGVAEMGLPSDARSRCVALVASIRGPGSAADATCYVLLSLIGRWRSARRRRNGAPGDWERDASSRAAATA